MIKIKNKRFISAVVIFSFAVALVQTSSVKATTINQQIKDAKQDVEEAQNNIDDAKDDISAVQAQIAANAKKLNTLIANQKQLQTDLANKQEEVNQAAIDLQEANDTLDEEYESMKLRIQFMYENSSEDSLWTAILTSNGLADMLTKVEYVADVYESDRKLMKQYESAVKAVETLSEQLNNEMDELMAKKDEYEAQQEKLEKLVASLQADKDKYESQLASYEDEKAASEETLTKLQEEKRRQEAAAANVAASNYNGGGTGESNSLGSSAYLTDASYNPSPVTNVTGQQIVDFAKQYVGNPYVWGGNSLTKGADCSGFVHLVYQNFGISSPRYSQAFKSVGQPVAYVNIQPGDVVVYPGHVAIYAGGGVIVEAQSSNAGITCGRSVNCHTITAIRRLV